MNVSYLMIVMNVTNDVRPTHENVSKDEKLVFCASYVPSSTLKVRLITWKSLDDFKSNLFFSFAILQILFAYISFFYI
jgi:hypothetical protein